MFDVTAQLVNHQEEITCLDKILYGKNSWTHMSLIHDEVVINLQSTKVFVFSDSVLCLSKVFQHPECNEAWKNKIAGARAKRYLHRLSCCQWRVDRIRVEHFPRAHNVAAL